MVIFTTIILLLLLLYYVNTEIKSVSILTYGKRIKLNKIYTSYASIGLIKVIPFKLQDNFVKVKLISIGNSRCESDAQYLVDRNHFTKWYFLENRKD